MSDDAVGEVVEGLWRFVALHPESNTAEWTAATEGGEDGWDQLVSWWVVAVPEGLVLIDPLVEDWQALDLLLSDRGDCLGIVRTCHWHQRSVAEAASRYGVEVWSKIHPDGRAAYVVDHEVRDQDELFGSLRVIDVERADEIALWLEEQGRSSSAMRCSAAAVASCGSVLTRGCNPLADPRGSGRSSLATLSHHPRRRQANTGLGCGGRYRDRIVEAFIKRVRLEPDGADERSGHPWDLPAVAQLAEGLELHPNVTYLIGENGSGKSTLLAGIAVAAGMSAEGGSSSFVFPNEGEAADAYAFSRRRSHTELADAIRLVRGARRPKTDFFLRAESLFVAATYLEQLDDRPLRTYGDKSLHEQSHGEGFLAILINRFGPNGLYLLDEPEAALSTQNCLTCLRRIHELVNQGSQFVISTHSPIILAYPSARIYRCTTSGLEAIDYEDAEPVRLTSSFLSARERFLDQLFAD